MSVPGKPLIFGSLNQSLRYCLCCNWNSLECKAHSVEPSFARGCRLVALDRALEGTCQTLSARESCMSPHRDLPASYDSNMDMRFPPKERASSRKDAPESLLSASWLLPGRPPFPDEHVIARFDSPRCAPRRMLDPFVPKQAHSTPLSEASKPAPPIITSFSGAMTRTRGPLDWGLPPGVKITSPRGCLFSSRQHHAKQRFRPAIPLVVAARSPPLPLHYP